MAETSNGPLKFQYIDSLDSVRGLAAWLVLLFHASYGLLPGGWVGVDLFFVLSGYLITSLLRNEYSLSGKLSLSRFYARRALRLFPPLIICVLLANILWPVTKHAAGANQALATTSALFYFTNFFRVYVTGNLGHLWSLSVEEHFYLLWPLLLLFFVLKISFRQRVIFLVALICIVTISKIVAFHYERELTFGMFKLDPFRFTIFKVDGIIMGALLAFTLSKQRILQLQTKTKSKSTLLILAILFAFCIVLLTVSTQSSGLKNGGFILTNALCTLAILTAITFPHHPLLTTRLLKWFGKRSYGIYVYHIPVFFALEGLRQNNSVGNFALITLLRFSISIALAALSYKYIERPILKYKKRFEVERSEAPALATQFV